MKRELLETYRIGRHAIRIYSGQFMQEDAPGYHVMVNGCGIGLGSDLKTIEEARVVAFQYAERRLKERANELKLERQAIADTLWELMQVEDLPKFLQQPSPDDARDAGTTTDR